MDSPILKSHCERFKAHVDLDIDTATQLLAPYTKDTIDELFLLSEGCANTNYKVTFKNSRLPVVIRIYLREKTALAREVAIYKLVADKMPVAAHLYFDESCTLYPHPYSIMEWIKGKLLREVILSKNENAIRQSTFEAGLYLNELRQIKFTHGGFFQENLQIRPFTKEEEYLPYVLSLLDEESIKNDLDPGLHGAVIKLVNTYSKLLPDENEANLTHADYDPANMMVTEVNGKWKIAAILDWEFAFAGTYLLDIGMMLRYSHRLPSYYENNFITGITSNGFYLPEEWKKQAKLMDLLCLLQLVHYSPFAERPKMNRDVVSLIADTIRNWETY
ncbi:MAG: aminoglycoside phosphotransferase family protein [Gammaproteobacteria bacterium]|nr:aminoglycoside phosphotransferase family protein [Gammaproteobacteria bacterium]MCW5584262.1 aminoglycoside phosphotransferase family protein [Gammaproteobacteria bacterium]